jgi:hypothetical protein
MSKKAIRKEEMPEEEPKKEEVKAEKPEKIAKQEKKKKEEKGVYTPNLRKVRTRIFHG